MTEPRTDPILYQCPFCSHAPYKDVLYALAHLAAKHPGDYEAMTVGSDHGPDLGDPPAVEQSETAEVAAGNPLAERRPRTLLEGEPAVNILYDGTNLHELEAALGEHVRLTQEGAQLLVVFGEDFAEGWQPLHDHSTVLLFNEGDGHPFQLTPAAALALGLR
jgi:hypothetical protein